MDSALTTGAGISRICFTRGGAMMRETKHGMLCYAMYTIQIEGAISLRFLVLYSRLFTNARRRTRIPTDPHAVPHTASRSLVHFFTPALTVVYPMIVVHQILSAHAMLRPTTTTTHHIRTKHATLHLATTQTHTHTIASFPYLSDA
ncbi:hypothetical protein P153DRAFT_73230 [Dothidotthia symphoricarpi CBS 119687]|uniref:Uncharacterized protein n=1 Tax=Dothidotthia symphoricarpi CBS 119687 TaxID=1392245 RepID=A0A6A6A7Y5_9PLEO|nr:uncharacterized protein P153DRAFT_73230 [Dothidotthia symphoricarpi CBS 119687]KAF2126927.1 hypothetical protein P153DRAFT_73230 [Dothidotthia symphoricarpi CBS 119687]